MGEPIRFVWADGQLLPADALAVRADDRAFTIGLGCYTTLRVERGALRYLERSVARLARDAATLGLPAVDPAAVRHGLGELARACFGQGPGIVRAQASGDGSGGPHLVCTARPVGAERACWSAATAPHAHEGPGPFAGVKLSGHPLLARVRAWLGEEGVDEALLFDAHGLLVEGSRTNLVAVDAEGQVRTPPLARGGCAGVAREILAARVPELVEADVARDEIGAMRELIAINSVRGARPVISFDGAPVGDGEPGPVAARLQQALAQEP